MKKILSCFCGLALLMSGVLPLKALPAESGTAADTPSKLVTAVSGNVPTYSEFLEKYKSAERPSEEVSVDISRFTGENVAAEENKNGRSGTSVTVGETGYVEFSAEVSRAGLYAVYVDFISGYSRGTNVERRLYINGELPHTEADSIVFGRLYKDAEDEIGKTDTVGNEIRPSQEEISDWQGRYLRDRMYAYNEPLVFYFEKGTNRIRFESVAEPLTIGSLTLKNPKALPSYKELSEEYKAKGYSFAGVKMQKIQGESAVLKSSPMIYPINDRTDPATEPSSSRQQKLNIIGGSHWQSPGQFIIWEFEAEKDGLYTFYIKGRQNITRGVNSTRTIYIDDEIPCKEMQNITFQYSDKWVMTPVGDGDTPCAVYLEKGKHQIKMEVTVGEISELIGRVQKVASELNELYLQFMIITGSSPDPMRDYMLDELVPEEIARLGVMADELQEVADWFTDYSGGKGNIISTLDTTIRQLKKMSADGDIIPKNMGYFKSNIGSLGDWVNSVRSQPLDVDYIAVVSEENPKFGKVSAGFFEQFAYDFQLFLRTFIDDYSYMGSAHGDGEENKSVTVWMYAGRDYAQILRKLIDQDFTAKKGIGVSLQLVETAALLPATVAGIGPDVTLGMGDGEPVNFAIRNAVIDLTQFPDFEEIAARFLPEQLVPLSFDGKTYALPETQAFQVMFYRKDILENLGIEIPQTWNDVISVIPLLQKNNMTFALPLEESMFYTMLFQNGGEIYNDGGMSSALDSEVGIATFKQWTNFYVNYELPQDFDFLSRFRTGESPLVINSYFGYNSIQAAAPEIRGLWGMTLLPGTEKPDGTIDRSMAISGSNCFILKTCKSRELAWEFLKWWTSADVQVQYGNEMESIMGESARYNSANIEAFNRIPWSSDFYKVLSEQMKWGRGVEQVPGGYFTQRHVYNAFRRVAVAKADAKETLYDYVYTINQELIGKRKEFGLPVE